jgi:hypothetical protein
MAIGKRKTGGGGVMSEPLTEDNLNELALQAWKDAFGDALTAVKLLRDSTDLGLLEALAFIQKTAHQVGGRCNLRIISAAEMPAEFAEQIAHERDDARLAEHRAARNVKKVRGAK